MKILGITNLYPPYVIGGYELLANRTLSTLQERGHEIHVATGHGDFDEPHIYSVFDVDLESKTEFYNPADTPEAIRRRLVYSHDHYTATRRLIDELQPDVLSIWNLWQLTIAPMIAGRDAGIPVVTHLTDSWLLHAFVDNVNKWVQLDEFFTVPEQYVRAALRRWLYRRVQPSNLIIPSYSLMSTYTRMGFGFPQSAFHHVPHGIDTSMFPRKWDVDVTYDKVDTDDGNVRLLYVGQLWSGKGIQFLLQALGKLKGRGIENFHLYVYGKGTDNFLDYMKDMIVRAGIKPHVSLMGIVPYEELASVYRQHDILVFPSVWNEPFALVPLEAMSTGLPIVASTAGGTKEAVRHEETGLVFEAGDSIDLADKLERLLHAPDLREQFSRRAAEVARAEYDLYHMVDQVEALYTTVR